MENWYKIAKIGDQHLKAKMVPEANIPIFKEYLDSLPDYLSKLLMKNVVSPKPTLSLEELKEEGRRFQENGKKPVKPSIDPKMEAYVKKLTDNNSERDWLRGLVKSGRFKEEDVVKIKNMIRSFRAMKSDKKLSDFKDDVELAKFIETDKPVKEMKASGNYAMIDSGEGTLGKIELYRILDQEALDSIAGGYGVQWCVLTENNAYQYEPFEYYCFFIAGQPSVLVHTGTDQIKDIYDDALTDSQIIIDIDPFVQKHILSKEDAQNLGGDFNKYEENLGEIQNIRENSHDREYIEEAIRADTKTFYILEKELWPTYVECFIAEYFPEIWGFTTDDMPLPPYAVLSFVGDYCKLHKPDIFQRGVEMFKMTYKLKGASGQEDVSQKPIETEADRIYQTLRTFIKNNPDMAKCTNGRYHKTIPDVWRTPELNAQVITMREEAIKQHLSLYRFYNEEFNKEEGLPRTEHAPMFKCLRLLDQCPFKEVTQDAEVQAFMQHYGAMVITGDTFNPKNSLYRYHNNVTSFKDEDFQAFLTNDLMTKMEARIINDPSTYTDMMELEEDKFFEGLLFRPNVVEAVGNYLSESVSKSFSNARYNFVQGARDRAKKGDPRIFDAFAKFIPKIIEPELTSFNTDINGDSSKDKYLLNTLMQLFEEPPQLVQYYIPPLQKALQRMITAISEDIEDRDDYGMYELYPITCTYSTLKRAIEQNRDGTEASELMMEMFTSLDFRTYWRKILMMTDSVAMFEICPYPEIKNDPEIKERFTQVNNEAPVSHAPEVQEPVAVEDTPEEVTLASLLNKKSVWSSSFNDNVIYRF